MFKSIQEARQFIQENGIQMVDFKLTDLDGRWRHLTIPAERLNEGIMEHGIGFDGSNYGYAMVDNSDMVFIPDLATGIVDPYAQIPTLSFVGDVMVIQQPHNRPFAQYPRNVARRAVAYMQETGIADEMIIGPEYEYHMFDALRYQVEPNRMGFALESSEAAWSAGDPAPNSGFHCGAHGGYHIDQPFDLNFDIRNRTCLQLAKYGIDVKCQLVLCRGINDGEELRRTLGDLLELTPMVQSIAAVPCGVTDYRHNLFKQTPYDAETSAAVIDIMEEFGDECKRRHGKRIIYPSDEWYLKAGRPIPPEEFYEDFDQLENGVGMMRLFEDEFRAELDRPHRIYGTKQIDVVTGTMAGPLITEMMDELHRQYPMIDVKVHVVKNNFFGGNVGVAGLVTATDIIAQCEGKLESGTLGIPAVMLREEKDTFLDDVTIAQLGERLGVKVEVLPVSGGDEAKALLRTGLHISRRRRA